MPELAVLDSTIHYEEAGQGRPIVLLHGNPTSSYLWRNVIPGLAGEGRCLAPDLIGMGRSGKPSIAYHFADHARYLDAWFDALDLRDVTIVGHDWGGALGFHWATRHPDRVAGLAFFETIIRPLSWEEWPENARGIFQGFRAPGKGEELVLERNMFVEAVLPGAVITPLSDETMAAYRAPFATAESRRPTLQWPREIPIDGEPADVVGIVEAYDRWLASTPDVPKLLLTFDPGAIMSPAVLDWCRSTIAGLEVEPAGRGSHFAPEDQPEAIAGAVSAWRRRHDLGGGG